MSRTQIYISIQKTHSVHFHSLVNTISVASVSITDYLFCCVYAICRSIDSDRNSDQTNTHFDVGLMPFSKYLSKWKKHLCFPTPFPVQKATSAWTLWNLMSKSRVKIYVFFLDSLWIEFLCTSSALPCVYEFALVPHLFSRWNKLDFYGVRVVGSVQCFCPKHKFYAEWKRFTQTLCEFFGHFWQLFFGEFFWRVF